jgi:hypothetical protein
MKLIDLLKQMVVILAPTSPTPNFRLHTEVDEASKALLNDSSFDLPSTDNGQ